MGGFTAELTPQGCAGGQEAVVVAEDETRRWVTLSSRRDEMDDDDIGSETRRGGSAQYLCLVSQPNQPSRLTTKPPVSSCNHADRLVSQRNQPSRLPANPREMKDKFVSLYFRTFWLDVQARSALASPSYACVRTFHPSSTDSWWYEGHGDPLREGQHSCGTHQRSIRKFRLYA